MKICVVHPKITSTSAKKLAVAIGAHVYNPYKGGHYDQYDLVFNYGYGGGAVGHLSTNQINPCASVVKSTDKIACYDLFKKHKVPTCDYVTNQKDVPQTWNWVVCRETTTGRNCEGVTITRPYDLIPNCPLYTKFFTHDAEYRMIVYKGKVLGRYRKCNLQDGQFDLEYMLPQGFEELDKSACNAAKAVGLDYAGVDVLCQEKTGKHIVLEVNSGPLLTDEVCAQLVKLLK